MTENICKRSNWQGLTLQNIQIAHAAQYQKSESEVIQLCPTLCNPLGCSLSGFSVHGISQARILTGVGCHFLLQGVFPTQGSNPHLLHWQVDSLPLSHQRSPYLCFTIEETKLQSWVTSLGFIAGKWLIQELHKCLFNSKIYGLSLMCLIRRWIKHTPC